MKKLSAGVMLYAVLLGAIALNGKSCTFLQVPLGGPIAIQSSPSGELRIAVCVDIDSRGFFMSEQATDESETTYFWQSDNSISIRKGDVLSPTDPPAGVGAGTNPSLQAGSYVKITILDSSGNGEDTIAADYWIPEGGLSSSLWLQSNGSLTQVSCPE